MATERGGRRHLPSWMAARVACPPRIAEARTQPFCDQAPLQFRNRTKDGEDHLAGRRGCVHLLASVHQHS